MRRGDICVAAARGAYTGQPRPVVIVQDDRFDATETVTVCPLTTSDVAAPLVRIAVEPTDATGIQQSSQIMVDKVPTMPRGNVGEHVGRLIDADLVRLDRALLVFLGLADRTRSRVSPRRCGIAVRHARRNPCLAHVQTCA